MCMDGLGIAQLPHFLAREGLESGALVSLYPSYRLPEPGSGVFAIYPKRDYLPARTRVFIDFLTAALADKGEGANHTWAENWVPVNAGGQPVADAIQANTLRATAEDHAGDC